MEQLIETKKIVILNLSRIVQLYYWPHFPVNKQVVPNSVIQSFSS